MSTIFLKYDNTVVHFQCAIYCCILTEPRIFLRWTHTRQLRTTVRIQTQHGFESMSKGVQSTCACRTVTYL